MITFALGGLFTAVEDGAASDTEIFLEELKGWDGGTVEIATVPKLYGSGSYITEIYIPEQEIEATVLLDSSTVNFRDLVASVSAKMRTLTTVVATRTINGSTTSKEVRIREVSTDEIMSETQGRFVVKLLQTDI